MSVKAWTSRRLWGGALMWACLAAACGSPSATDALRVGVLLPYTGESAALGRNYEQALILAQERVNEVGVAGKPLELVFANARATGAPLDALIAKAPVAVIGLTDDESADTFVPSLLDSGIIPASGDVMSNTGLDLAPGELWLRFSPSNETMAQKLAEHIASGAGVVHIVVAQTKRDEVFADAFAARLTSLGGVVGERIGLSVEQVSYREEVTTLAAQATSGAKVHVLLAAPPRTAARFINDLASQLRPEEAQFYFPPGLRSQVFVENTRAQMLEGCVGITPEVFVGASAFREVYAERFSGDEPLDGAYYHYDALALLVLMIEKASVARGGGVPSQPEIASTLLGLTTPSGRFRGWDDLASALQELRDGEQIYFSGLTGPLSMNASGMRSTAARTFWTIARGQLTDLQ